MARCFLIDNKTKREKSILGILKPILVTFSYSLFLFVCRHREFMIEEQDLNLMERFN
ncbi:hypothetical protein GM3709_1273 [Geminocystis sp. NIES-3709]|nr:hypothetical protein GM3709_1273 [Geminocystis sp. NIES-3709]